MAVVGECSMRLVLAVGEGKIGQLADGKLLVSFHFSSPFFSFFSFFSFNKWLVFLLSFFLFCYSA